MALKLDGNYDLIGSLRLLCRHRAAGEHQVCAAFPLAILRDEYDHHLPYPGDQGIQFAACLEDEAARPQEREMIAA